eukprot:1024167-Pelagomonas_calceolata.AAC.1
MKASWGPSVRYVGVYGGVYDPSKSKPCMGDGISLGPDGLGGNVGTQKCIFWNLAFILRPDGVRVTVDTLFHEERLHLFASTKVPLYIWGTRFKKKGAEMDCPLQTVHLCLLKRILGIKCTSPN